MKNIAILHTGGTFVMEKNEHGQLTPGKYALNYIEENVYPRFPEISFRQISLFNIDSSLLRPEHWQRIAIKIAEIYDNYDGFVIIHGTDTMAYTACALSFMLTNLEKPVVITGSQLPLETLRTDAYPNLTDAIVVASDSSLREVVVAFNHTAYRGNRVKKKNVWDFDAFYTPNYEPLIHLGISMDEKLNLFLPKPETQFKPDFSCDSKVALIPFFPGLDFSTFHHMVKHKIIHGIVVEAYGSGNIPSDNPGLEKLFEFASMNEIPIAVCSQSPFGRVNLSLYEAASKAEFYGLISAQDMTREATLVKMMVALGRFNNMDKIKEYMKTNIAGEKE